MKKELTQKLSTIFNTCYEAVIKKYDYTQSWGFDKGYAVLEYTSRLDSFLEERAIFAGEGDDTLLAGFILNTDKKLSKSGTSKVWDTMLRYKKYMETGAEFSSIEPIVVFSKPSINIGQDLEKDTLLSWRLHDNAFGFFSFEKPSAMKKHENLDMGTQSFLVTQVGSFSARDTTMQIPTYLLKLIKEVGFHGVRVREFEYNKQKYYTFISYTTTDGSIDQSNYFAMFFNHDLLASKLSEEELIFVDSPCDFEIKELGVKEE